jgi:hypothetical protein
VIFPHKTGLSLMTKWEGNTPSKVAARLATILLQCKMGIFEEAIFSQMTRWANC